MGRVRWILLVLTAVLFFLPSLAAAQAKPPQGTVPAVEGMPVAKAQQALSSAGFNPMVTMEDVTEQGKGNVVLKQGVPAGQILPKGSRVPITVGRYTAPAPVPVPKVEGMKAADAQRMLTQQGWSVKMESRPVTDPSKADTVVQQAPTPGDKVLQKQQPVTLMIGRYEAQTSVPSVIGMPLDKAQRTLGAAGLNAVVTMEDVTEQGKGNVVLKQGVPAGKTLSKGTNVPITVGKYRPPVATTLPKVEGMKAADAQRMLTQQGWSVKMESKPVTDLSKSGSVIQQVPPAGSPIQKQQPVTLLVGQYVPQATVPNVVGMPLAKAQQTMVSAGLNAVVTMEDVTEQGKGNVVLKQGVPAGKTLSKGTNVPVTVGRYKEPAKVPVPNAVGMPAGPAAQMLQKQGWKVNVEKKTVFDAKQNNIVLQQSPAHGTQAVPSQQVVTLTVGSYQVPAVGKGGNVRVYPQVNQPGTLNPPIPPDAVNK